MAAGRLLLGLKKTIKSRPAALVGIEENDLLFPFGRRFVLDLRKKRRHAILPRLGPCSRPCAHERQRHGLRDGLWIPALDGPVEVDLRHRSEEHTSELQ